MLSIYDITFLINNITFYICAQNIYKRDWKNLVFVEIHKNINIL